MMTIGKGTVGDYLDRDDVRQLTTQAFEDFDLQGKRVLIIVPDSTRTMPLPLFFELFFELLAPHVTKLDYLVALGTHQPMGAEELNRLLGISEHERTTTYADVGIFNHRWDVPDTLITIGTIPQAELGQISQGLMAQDLPITVNKLIFDYDLLVICGPVFPHEVVGFSGGNKYFFPGISGPEVINATHWLGALMTSYAVIGSGYTPVRKVIDKAASFIDIPKLCFCPVVTYQGLVGLFIGRPEAAWEKAADLSSQVHITYVDKPYQRVLSVMPEMYDDLWTAAKGMYKMEPVVADGGEVIIYAPHIDEISYTHGATIDQVGYHVRDYFVKQWDKFKDYPWGVLAHSTHLRGIGTYDLENDIERPRVKVTLATGISRERCERVNLSYLDPASIDVSQWAKDESVLVVPKAGEMLYRLKR